MGAMMSASRFLHFKGVGNRDTIQLKPEQADLLAPALVKNLNDALDHVNTLLANCDIILTVKRDRFLNLEESLEKSRGTEEFQESLRRRTREFARYGFTDVDLEILAFAQLAYDERMKIWWSGKKTLEGSRTLLTPDSPASPVEACAKGEGEGLNQPPIIPTRRAPSPPEVKKETGTRPKDVKWAKDIAVQFDSDVGPPPNWIPEDPPMKKMSAGVPRSSIKRPTFPPPPPPPEKSANEPKALPRRVKELKSAPKKMEVDRVEEFIMTTLVSSKSPTPPPSPQGEN